MNDDPTLAQQPKSGDGGQKQPVKTVTADDRPLGEQVMELQKQVAELRTRLNGMQTPRIVAAGTATFQR
jgi:hypothetical protein